jgi:hypothetical protein
VHCSFPASGSNAPDIRLVSRAAELSTWKVSWRPHWSAEVLLHARHLGVQCSVLMKVVSFDIRGDLVVNLKDDLSDLKLQFSEMPKISVALDSAVTFGPHLPLPLGLTLQKAVIEGVDSWVMLHMVQAALNVRMERFRRKTSLTDDDVLHAAALAKEAARRLG